MANKTLTEIDPLVWRKHGSIRLGGKRTHLQYTMPDPCCEELSEAIHALKYGVATHGQALRVAAVAEAYSFLCRCHSDEMATRKLLSARRALDAPDGGEG